MSNTIAYETIDLQLFADGGAGGAGAGGAAAGGASAGASTGAEGAAGTNGGVAETGVNNAAGVADQQANTQTAEENVVKDRAAEFEKLIKGDYKDLYDARVQDTIQKRLKGTKETVEKYETLSPVLEMLGSKYGVDASDVNALTKAIQEDDSYYEDEALERGLSVEQLKEIKKMERENASLKKQMDEQRRKDNADRLYNTWLSQSEETKQVYPSFSLEAELQNERFASLISNNVDVRTAYEVIHRDEIVSGAMQFATKKAAEKVANSIIAGSKRPLENGNAAQGAVNVITDVSRMTKAERQALAERAMRGEKIRL